VLLIVFYDGVKRVFVLQTGGRNTVLNDAIRRNIPLITDRPTIIMGADVTHPQPGEDSSPSIAAVCISYFTCISLYYCFIIKGNSLISTTGCGLYGLA